jgi:general secretion pathway protein A
MHIDPFLPLPQETEHPAAPATEDAPDPLARLQADIRRGVGLSVLTVEGPSGTGPVAQALATALENTHLIGWIPNPRLPLTEFLLGIGQAYRIPLSSGEHSVELLMDLLLTGLRQHLAQGQRNLLVIPEAQQTPFFVLRQLMDFCQTDADGIRAMQILLVGTPELGKLLAQESLAPVKRQIKAQYHLSPMTQAPAPAATPAPALMPAPPLAASAFGPASFPPEPADDPLVAVPVTPPVPFVPAPPPEYGPVTRQRAPEPGLWRTWWPHMAGGLAAVLLLAAFWPSGSDPSSSRSHREVSGKALGLSNPGAPAADAPVAKVAVAQAEAPVDSAGERPEPPTPQAPVKGPADADRPSLASLDDSHANTWVVLARRWKERVSAATPCEDAQKVGLQCFRRPDLTIARLKGYNRPGLVELSEGSVSRWILLQGMNKDHVTLASGTQVWTMTHASFNAMWNGSYATLWRLPPGQTARVTAATTKDTAGLWLDEQLVKLQARGLLDKSASTFGARVSAFQRQRETYGEGRATPSTFMLVNPLVGVKEPRLTDPLPASR